MSLFQKPTKPEVTETRTFSCPGLSGFTFDYPVFKGWEPNGSFRILLGKETTCALFLNTVDVHDNAERMIEVNNFNGATDISSWRFRVPTDAPKNPHGLSYASIPDAQGYQFTDPSNFRVNVDFYAGDVDKGFPNDIFFQTVINSFRLAQTTPSKIDLRFQQIIDLANQEYTKAFPGIKPIAPTVERVMFSDNLWRVIVYRRQQEFDKTYLEIEIDDKDLKILKTKIATAS